MKYDKSVELRKHTKKFSRFDILFKKILKTRIFRFLYFLKYVSNLKKQKTKTDLPNSFLKIKLHFFV